MRSTTVAAWFVCLALVQTWVWAVEETGTPLASPRSIAQGALGQTSKPADPRIHQNYGRLPMFFEPNQGQTDAQVRYLARGSGYTLFLTEAEAVLALRRPRPREDEDRYLGMDVMPDSLEAMGAALLAMEEEAPANLVEDPQREKDSVLRMSFPAIKTRLSGNSLLM